LGFGILAKADYEKNQSTWYNGSADHPQNDKVETRKFILPVIRYG